MQRTKFWLFVVALAVLLGLAPSRATILFAGGEDVDISCIGSCSTITTAGQFRSGYARAALTVPGALVADPPTNRIVSAAFASTASIWVHAVTFTGSATVQTINNSQTLGLYSPDGVRRLILRGTGTAGQVKISTRNAAGTITDLVTCTAGGWPVFTALTKLDWYINYVASGAGHTTLYAGGVQICDYSGNITTDAANSLNQADFATPCTTACSAAGEVRWSEIIVADSDTRDLNLVTCAPQANGTNMAWTGAYSNINGTTYNDGSAITSGTNNQVAEFTCPSMPAGQFLVPAVVQSMRLQIGTTGPQHFRCIIRPAGGADYDNGADLSGTTSFASYPDKCVWPTNPATSGAWSLTDVGAGFQQGLKSLN